jgi:CheY-like chemotaxis protein
MVERTHAHEHDLNKLVETAEGVAHHASELAGAFARGNTRADELSALCSTHVRRSADNAAATLRACVSAREQHVTAHRLYATLNDRFEDSELLPSHAAAVLVVDDTADVRDIVALHLRDAGFVVRTAVNGLDALLTAYEMRPDVIVMDLTMPVLDGIEATRLIKATEATRRSRVIAYTGNVTPLEPWFVAVVLKPSSPDVVLAAVQDAASR